MSADAASEDEQYAAQEVAQLAAKVKKRDKKRKIDPLTPPPPPSEFPSWAYERRDYFFYELVHKSKISNARVGRIHTPHGVINTPGFVSVATNGALKAVDHRAADETGCELMFMNTYHLLLQPGPATIDKMGGLHKFANRSRPIITDSGGFQVEATFMSRRLEKNSFTYSQNMRTRAHAFAPTGTRAHAHAHTHTHTARRAWHDDTCAKRLRSLTTRSFRCHMGRSTTSST